MYKVENRSKSGRVLGYAECDDYGRVGKQVWSVIKNARSKPWNQISTIVVYCEGKFKFARSV